jgi:hypothetical protein
MKKLISFIKSLIFPKKEKSCICGDSCTCGNCEKCTPKPQAKNPDVEIIEKKSEMVDAPKKRGRKKKTND